MSACMEPEGGFRLPRARLNLQEIAADSHRPWGGVTLQCWRPQTAHDIAHDLAQRVGSQRTTTPVARRSSDLGRMPSEKAVV